MCYPCNRNVFEPKKILSLTQLKKDDVWDWTTIDHEKPLPHIVPLPNITYELKDIAKSLKAQWMPPVYEKGKQVWYAYSNNPWLHRLKTMNIEWHPWIGNV